MTSGCLVGGGMVTDIRLGRFDMQRYLANRLARVLWC